MLYSIQYLEGKSRHGMLVFVEGGKQENLEKNLWIKARNSDKLNPRMAPAEIEPGQHG